MRLIIDTNNLESITTAIASGWTTPELLANSLDNFEIIEDCLVPIDGGYTVNDGNSEVTYGGMDRDEAVEEYMSEGDWGEINQTMWVPLSSYKIGINKDGQFEHVDMAHHSYQLDPEEPECRDKDLEHKWESPYDLVGGLKENPGVWGHGGGVIYEEVCMLCGCLKTTNTWAQNPTNGDQGLTSVSYKEGIYGKEVSEKLLKAAIENLKAVKWAGGYVIQDEQGTLKFVHEDEMENWGAGLISDMWAHITNFGRIMSESSVKAYLTEVV